jgi:hypothetical protein
MKTKGTRDQIIKWGTGVLAAICFSAVNARGNLVGDWRFNGNLNDSSGFFNDGVFHGTAPASYVTNSGHVALALDGADQYVSVPANGNLLDLNAESFTIAAWLYLHAPFTSRVETLIAGKADTVSFTDYALTADYFGQSTNNATQAGFFGYTGNGGGHGNVADYYGYYDTYLNLVLTYDHPSGTLRIYQNSTLVDTKTGLNGPTANPADLQIGNAFGTFLRSDLDEIQIYDQWMGGPQVTALYNSGNGPIPVPEPTSACLVALGLAALGGRIWNRKRA